MAVSSLVLMFASEEKAEGLRGLILEFCAILSVGCRANSGWLSSHNESVKAYLLRDTLRIEWSEFR